MYLKWKREELKRNCNLLMSCDDNITQERVSGCFMKKIIALEKKQGIMFTFANRELSQTLRSFLIKALIDSEFKEYRLIRQFINKEYDGKDKEKLLLTKLIQLQYVSEKLENHVGNVLKWLDFSSENKMIQCSVFFLIRNIIEGAMKDVANLDGLVEANIRKCEEIERVFSINQEDMKHEGGNSKVNIINKIDIEELEKSVLFGDKIEIAKFFKMVYEQFFPGVESGIFKMGWDRDEPCDFMDEMLKICDPKKTLDNWGDLSKKFEEFLNHYPLKPAISSSDSNNTNGKNEKCDSRIIKMFFLSFLMMMGFKYFGEFCDGGRYSS